MKIVADTNTFIAVALEEPEKRQIIQFTVGKELVAPEVLPFEVGNALTAMVSGTAPNRYSSGFRASGSVQYLCI